MTSFPRPPLTAVPIAASRLPRSLPPIPTPERPSDFPPLPSSPRPSAFTSTWTRSTHIIPAVVPRTTGNVTPPPTPAGSGPTRKPQIRQVLEQVLAARRRHDERPATPGERSRKQLWNCINRYVNRSHEVRRHPRPLTLFLAHPNGLPKEASDSLHLLSARDLTWHEDMGARAVSSARTPWASKVFRCRRRSMDLGSRQSW
jgi:hypothetical protein